MDNSPPYGFVHCKCGINLVVDNWAWEQWRTMACDGCGRELNTGMFYRAAFSREVSTFDEKKFLKECGITLEEKVVDERIARIVERYRPR